MLAAMGAWVRKEKKILNLPVFFHLSYVNLSAKCIQYNGVASGPAVSPGGTNNFQKNEIFYSEAKITALLILQI